MQIPAVNPFPVPMPGVSRGAEPQGAAIGAAAQTPARQAAVEGEQAQAVAELRRRDREVRTHERAHMAAGGQHVTGGMRLDHQRGPDGRYYAVGGEVSISTSPVPGDPQATLEKMQTVRRAALAPAEPSAQDLRVAAQAAAAAAQARRDIAEQRREDGDQAARAYGEVAAAESVRPGRIDLMA